MGRAATTIISALALAVLLAAPAAARPSPPTAAEIERATERFLERHPARRHPPPAASPRRTVTASLPTSRVVALYGAPQMGQTILGIKSPDGRGAQARRASRPVRGARRAPGRRRLRPRHGVRDRRRRAATASTAAARTTRSSRSTSSRRGAAGARLILDIQPGRSTFLDEIRELREWMLQPDVDVALDPEWNVGPRGIPGRTQGKVSAPQAERGSPANLAAAVRDHGLPPKLLVVHQFRQGSIRGRRRRSASATACRRSSTSTGSAPLPPKQAGYAALSVPRLFDGFSLFYRRDTPLMRPADRARARARARLPALPVAARQARRRRASRAKPSAIARFATRRRARGRRGRPGA